MTLLPKPHRGLRSMIPAALAAALAIAPTPAAAEPLAVFSTDFESGLPAEMTAPGAAIEAVQGWDGLGNGAHQFAGNFLRHHDPGFREVQLDLQGLPTHTVISISTLVALIDSWDYESFEILVDGDVVFSEWFDLASSRTTSYIPPVGALLSSETDLGFTAGFYYNNDHAYDLSKDGACSEIPHSSATATIIWRINDSSMGNWQGGTDESWAIEEVVVTVDAEPTPVRSETWGGMKARFRE